MKAHTCCLYLSIIILYARRQREAHTSDIEQHLPSNTPFISLSNSRLGWCCSFEFDQTLIRCDISAVNCMDTPFFLVVAVVVLIVGFITHTLSLRQNNTCFHSSSKSYLKTTTTTTTS